MQNTVFQSTPFATEEAAVAAVTGMAGQAAPSGMTSKIVSIITQEVNGLWIAIATVEMVEVEAEATPETDKKGEGKTEGGEEGKASGQDIVDIYYTTPAPGQAPYADTPGDAAEPPVAQGAQEAYQTMEYTSTPSDIAPEPAPQTAGAEPPPMQGMENIYQGMEESAPSQTDVVTGPETITADADVMAEQLKTDFNGSPDPIYAPVADSVTADIAATDAGTQYEQERREDERRRETAENYPVPPADSVTPAPLT